MPDQTDAISAIMAILVRMTPDDRVEVLAEINSNPVFCVHCGYGEPSEPNAHCKCWNDE